MCLIVLMGFIHGDALLTQNLLIDYNITTSLVKLSLMFVITEDYIKTISLLEKKQDMGHL